MDPRCAVAAVTLTALALLTAVASHANPIAYAQGTTVMAEWGGTTMREAQVFYAPRFDVSVGGGYVRLISDVDTSTRDIVYGRLNFLAKRWNLESAQANVFIWGGLGGAKASEHDGTVLAENVGAQFDFETRQVYFSAKSDLQRSAVFSDRIDTLQFGVSPVPHDFNTLATWIVVQARQYTGNIHDGTETALLLRLFKGNRWIEAGITNGGHLQAMFMTNF